MIVHDVPGVSVGSFPARWNYTATKTADIVPAPGFITLTPIGVDLHWAFNVTETCAGDACVYTTAIFPLIPEALLSDVPEATWVADGAECSLDVTYGGVQSRNVDGMVCVIRNHDVFALTVTKGVGDGRSVPVAFVGTWVQASSRRPRLRPSLRTSQ